MSTRQSAISLDHVNAINLIEVDFHSCAAVEAELKNYKNHLNDNSFPGSEAWEIKRQKLRSKLLFEISKVLKYNVSAIDIFDGGYAPDGWRYRDMQYTNAVAYINELREGTKAVPILLRNGTPSASAEPPTGPIMPKLNG